MKSKCTNKSQRYQKAVLCFMVILSVMICVNTDARQDNEAYYGYYVYEDNGIQEIFCVSQITKDHVFGKYLFNMASGSYDVKNFTWDITGTGPLTAKELFQNQQDFIRYTFDRDLYVTYPDGWWQARVYEYKCDLNQPEKYIDHPYLYLLLDGSNAKQSSAAPFYGIWTSASKAKSDEDREAEALRAAGFQADVYMTTDWSNLNSEPWYVVSAGRYQTEAAAQADLQRVQATGRPTAYIKYTGDYQG